MVENNNIDTMSRFALSITSYRNLDKELDWKVDTINLGIPTEVVIMQLKALIKNYEEGYFNNFNNKL